MQEVRLLPRVSLQYQKLLKACLRFIDNAGCLMQLSVHLHQVTGQRRHLQEGVPQLTDDTAPLIGLVVPFQE